MVMMLTIVSMYAQSFDVKGVVLDANKEAVIGASVMIKGSK